MVSFSNRLQKSKFELVRRRGLGESLEEFAARAVLDLDAARPYWRREALRLLGLKHGPETLISHLLHGPRISDQPVPTKSVTSYEEGER